MGWQINRAAGALDIAAHQVIRADDRGLIAVRSAGLQGGPAPVMARLARGAAMGRDGYCFRAVARFATGAPAWRPLNKVLALAVGRRESAWLKLDFYRIA